MPQATVLALKTMILSRQLKQWRGKRRQKEAAEALAVPYHTYRAYETGKRTPKGLALAELERRMHS